MSRDWSQIDSPEAMEILSQNRLWLDSDEDFFCLAAEFLGDISDFIATNMLYEPHFNDCPEDAFIWARSQVVAEGLVVAPYDHAPELKLKDGTSFSTYIEQAVFILRYFSDLLRASIDENKGGGEANRARESFRSRSR